MKFMCSDKKSFCLRRGMSPVFPMVRLWPITFMGCVFWRGKGSCSHPNIPSRTSSSLIFMSPICVTLEPWSCNWKMQAGKC